MGKQYTLFDLDERIELFRLHEVGTTQKEIARLIGRHPSTISRELRRNCLPKGGYKPAWGMFRIRVKNGHIGDENFGMQIWRGIWDDFSLLQQDSSRIFDITLRSGRAYFQERLPSRTTSLIGQSID